MSGLVAHRGLLLSSGEGGGGTTLAEMVLADIATFGGVYLRLGEASGTAAENEAGTPEGSYLNTPSLGNAALYTGGPTSMRTTASNQAASFPVAGIPATMEQMTLGVIVKPAALTGLRHLVNRDSDAGGGRRWQFRLNGSSVQFVKIPGTPQTITATHGMSVGQAHLLMVTVTAGGTVKLFGNGVSLGSGSVTPVTNYGGGGLDLLVGNRGLLIEGTDNTYSEAFLIFGDLEDARVAQYGAAVGLP